jgi:hypothetical protein
MPVCRQHFSIYHRLNGMHYLEAAFDREFEKNSFSLFFHNCVKKELKQIITA